MKMNRMKFRNDLDKMLESWDNGTHPLLETLIQHDFKCFFDIVFGETISLRFKNAKRKVSLELVPYFEKNVILVVCDEVYVGGRTEIFDYSEFETWDTENLIGRNDLNVCQLALDYFFSYFKGNELDCLLKIRNNTNKPISMKHSFTVSDYMAVPTGDASCTLLELIKKFDVSYFLDDAFRLDAPFFHKANIHFYLNQPCSSVEVYHANEMTKNHLFTISSEKDAENFAIWMKEQDEKIQNVLHQVSDVLSKGMDNVVIDKNSLSLSGANIAFLKLIFQNDEILYYLQSPNLIKRYKKESDVINAILYTLNAYASFKKMVFSIEDKLTKFAKPQVLARNFFEYKIKIETFGKPFYISLSYDVDYHTYNERFTVGDKVCTKESINKETSYKTVINDTDKFVSGETGHVIDFVYDHIFDYMKKNRLKTVFQDRN